MNPDELKRLLENGGVIENRQVAVVRQTLLPQCNVTIEKDDEKFILNIDVLLGPQGNAERYQIPFDLQGWARFRALVIGNEAE